MTEFTARNGLRIAEHTESLLGFAIYDGERNTLEDYGHLNDQEMQALREFFRAEEDDRLGRWRWPENPDYVVYERDGGGYIGTEIRVVCELDGGKVDISRDHVDRLRDAWDEQVSNPHWHAARAYFDAHPEPKPWHAAECGESWYLEPFDAVYTAVGNEPKLWFTRSNVYDGIEKFDLTDPRITRGRRVWPEAST